MIWTDEKEAELRRLWETGMPARDIGKALGYPPLPDYGKSAVIGKAWRLKLKAKREGTRGNIRKAPPAPPLLTVATNRNRCAWPIGHPGEPGFHYCGSETMARPDGSRAPFCREHAERACSNFDVLYGKETA